MVLALVIGLERNYRGAELEQQLSDLRIPVERSYGVEGEHEGRPVRSYTKPGVAEVLYGRDLTDGELGCALAHRVCCERMLRGDAEWALVFEDDARVVRPDVLMELVQLLDDMSPMVEPVVLMTYGRQMVADPRFRSKLQHSELQELIRTPMTATAYFLNRAAARHILDTGLPLRNTADWPVSVEGHVRFLSVYPWAVEPDESGQASTIGGRDRDVSTLFKLGRRVSGFLFVKWFLHRTYYRSLREYVDWEIRRRVVHLVVGRSAPYRVADGAAELPQAPRLAVAADVALGGRRDARLVERIAAGAPGGV